MTGGACVRPRATSSTACESRFNRTVQAAPVKGNSIAIVARFHGSTDPVAAQGETRIIASDATASAVPSRFDDTSFAAPIELNRVAVITGFHTYPPAIAANGGAC